MVKFIKIIIKYFDRYSGLVFLGGLIASKAVIVPINRRNLGVTKRLQGSISVLPLSINFPNINSLLRSRNKAGKAEDYIYSIFNLHCLNKKAVLSHAGRIQLVKSSTTTLENVCSC